MSEKIFFVIFFFTYLVKAQNKNAFDSVYTKTYIETSLKNFDKATYIADSLFVISETPYFQTKSLMLSATLYQQKGAFRKAVDYAQKADQIISNTNNEPWKARVSGFLATQYRILKLYDKSKKYSEKAFEISEKIENPEMANSTKGLMQQEMAYLEQEKKNYRKSINHIIKAQQYFSKITQNKDALTANNEQLLGLNYFKLKEFDKSQNHYQKALELTDKMPPYYLKGLVYDGLANIYLEKNDLKKAKENIDLAEKISEESQYLLLKNEINGTLKKYYLLTKNQDSLKKTEEKAEIITEQLSENISSFIDEDFSKLEKKNTEIEKKSMKKNIILGVSLFFILLIGLLFLQYRRKQKESIATFKEIIRKSRNEIGPSEMKIKAATNYPQIEKEQANPIMQKISEQEGVMTLETEQKLLKKLEEFEESDLCINRNISLPFLSSHFGNNTKYLSYVINTHKKKTFNNYINDLRIKYIVKKLNEEPLYRQYKIAVLAEEAGFSSPNKFATIFKEVTSLSPSLFIKYLDKGISDTEDK